MNRSDLRVKAVVDWVDVEIQTTRATNFQTVQRAFAKALGLPVGLNFHVRAIDANAGGGASAFRVRIHDVKRHSDIQDQLIKVSAELGRDVALKQGFKIRKIEIALDAYCHDPATQAARFYKFMTHPVSCNRRMYREERDLPPFGVPNNFNSISRHLSEGWQIGIGNKTDDRYQHIYFKTTDTHYGERQEVEHRARIELRLSGVGLPCQTPEEWQQFKFETLTQYFHFTRLKDGLDPMIQMTAEALDQIGERKTRKRVHDGRESGSRQYSRAVQADKELNDKARKALANLSARWKGTGKRGRPTSAKTTFCCAKTDGINEQTPHENGKVQPNSNNYIYKEEQQDEVTATDIQHREADATTRGGDKSNESAEPTRSDMAHGAIEQLLQLYDASPEVKNEHDRINELMKSAIGNTDILAGA